MGAGNHIYLSQSAGKLFYYDQANTSRFYELTSPSNSGIANGTTSFELPSQNGTLAVTGATNNAEFFEIASATAPTADNQAHPVISIYDSSDRSSIANSITNGQEHAGAIRWFFNNDAGNKSFLGGIRGIVSDSADGEERGSLEIVLHGILGHMNNISEAGQVSPQGVIVQLHYLMLHLVQLLLQVLQIVLTFLKLKAQMLVLLKCLFLHLQEIVQVLQQMINLVRYDGLVKLILERKNYLVVYTLKLLI